jgi:hypothetical protein
MVISPHDATAAGSTPTTSSPPRSSTTLSQGREYRELDFPYIHDLAAEDHAELMAGEPATAYEVRREVWVPDEKDLFKDFSFERHERVAAFQ